MARGLEVIQLMFERTPDFAGSAKAARDFADKFAIDYPVLVAGTVTDDDVLQKLPQVAAFKAYPTMFAIDRKGIVRMIHTGFAGPATGDAITRNRPRADRARRRAARRTGLSGAVSCARFFSTSAPSATAISTPARSSARCRASSSTSRRRRPTFPRRIAGFEAVLANKSVIDRAIDRAPIRSSG